MPDGAATAIALIPPAARHEAAFLDAVARSVKLHRPWVNPPHDAQRFAAYLAKSRLPAYRSFLLVADEALAGAVNVSEIVMGNFRSAYLGYYVFAPFQRRGVMRRGLTQVVDHCFDTLGLNRLEANIQPGNTASIALVSQLGFRREGFSERFLKIDGVWRDHERWAVHRQRWRAAEDRG